MAIYPILYERKVSLPPGISHTRRSSLLKPGTDYHHFLSHKSIALYDHLSGPHLCPFPPPPTALPPPREHPIADRTRKHGQAENTFTIVVDEGDSDYQYRAIEYEWVPINFVGVHLNIRLIRPMRQ